MNRYKVITLCGSSKFKDDFLREKMRLNLAGNIVLDKNVFFNVEDDMNLSLLDNIENAMIDMSDEIFIINRGGYIDRDTRRKINYATISGKPIKYMEINYARN